MRQQSSVEITRDFNAPRESVFRMWTDPEKVAKWWGPEGNTTIASEIDARPGGAMKIEERLSDGSVHLMTGTFSKVVTPELVVFRSASPGVGNYRPFEALNTVAFEELGPRRTRVKVSVQVVMAAPEQLESLAEAFRGGWSQSFEKLQRALQ